MNTFDSAFHLTVGALVSKHAVVPPETFALEAAGRSLIYLELNWRVNRLTSVLLSKGVRRGDWDAIVSESRIPYRNWRRPSSEFPCLA